jgi:hypothetical protein
MHRLSTGRVLFTGRGTAAGALDHRARLPEGASPCGRAGAGPAAPAATSGVKLSGLNYYTREYSWSILSCMSVPLTLLYRLEADLRWMDHTAGRLDMLRQEFGR